MDAEEAQKKRAALVYNPTKVEPRRPSARPELAAEAGWAEPSSMRRPSTTSATTPPAPPSTRRWMPCSWRGGDGTVRAVAEALTSTGVPLTIVPSGTGNLLARETSTSHSMTATR